MPATRNRIPAVVMAALVLAVAVFGVIVRVALADPPSEPPGKPPGNIPERLKALEAQVAGLEAENADQQLQIDGLRVDADALETETAAQAARITNLETLQARFEPRWR